MIWYVDHRSDNPASSWEDLARTLGGSFTARVRGLVSPGLDLLTPENEVFGRLSTDSSGATRLRAGDLEAEIRQPGVASYVLTGGGAEILTAEPTGTPALLGLRSGTRRYEASISLLRNRATATSSTGNESARLSGGLTNRRYRATFDPQDPASLLIAVLLLHHTFALRSRAFRTRS